MAQTETKFKPIGEELTQIAKSRRTGRLGFRFPIKADDAYQVIGAFYIAEVARRGKDCQMNDFVLDKINKLACMITAERPKFGVLMTGKCGNGKTTLLNAFNQAARFLLDKGYINHEQYGFQHKTDFGLDIYTAKQITTMSQRDLKRFDSLASTPMLAIDDLGEEPKEVLNYGNAINPVVEVIESRYAAQRFTMITTNLDAEEIAAKYGVRVADRLREMMFGIVFGNHQSFRR